MKKQEPKIAGHPARIFVKSFRNGKMVHRYHFSNWRRFYNKYRHAKIEKDLCLHVLVKYVPELNRVGKKVTMTNSMTCTSLDDLNWAIKTFIREYQ